MGLRAMPVEALSIYSDSLVLEWCHVDSSSQLLWQLP